MPSKDVTLIAFCYISTSLKVTITMETTIQTLKETRMPLGIQRITPITSLRCVSGIDINNPNSFSESLVFNKELKLSKSPLVNPFIIFSCCSDANQIFHNNNISFIQSTNNSLADFMIFQSHKLSPSTRNSFKLSLGRLRAFRLKLSNKFIMLDSKIFKILSIEFIVGSDCNFIDTAVHSKNFEMLVRSPRAFCGECENKEHPIFVINFQKTFNNLPVKIFQSIIGNFYRNLNSAFNCRNTQNIILEGKTSWRIVSNGTEFNKWFVLGFLNHPTSLFNTRDRKLSRKSKSSQIRVNKRVEFDIISDSHLPSFINTELESLLVEFNSFDNQIINFQLNRNTSNQHHNNIKKQDYLNIYILNFGGIYPPKHECMGIRNAMFI